MCMTNQIAGALLVTAPGMALSERTAEMRQQSIPLTLDPQEEWRLAPGFPDYEVSSLGRVRRRTDAPTGGTRAGHILSPCPRGRGYLAVTFYRNGKRPQPYVHRMVCEAFHGPPPSPEHQAAHLNGKKTDNRSANLRWKLPVANIADTRDHGTMVTGERSNFARFSDREIERVFALAAVGWSRRAIADELGMTPDYVTRLLNGKASRIRNHSGRVPS